MHAPIVSPPSAPLRYSIDADAQLLIIELLSIEDGPALLAALRDIRADRHFRSSLDVCVDCNTLRSIPSCDDVKRLARVLVACPHRDSPRQWALIATWRPLYEAARLLSTAVSAPNVTLQVFHAWSDARLWLATMRPMPPGDVPWVGPSRALNDLLRGPGPGGR